MDFVNFSAAERVDLADLNAVAQKTGLGLSQEALAYFAQDPNAQAPAAIVSGFAASNPTGNQIQVTRGVALLGQRVGLSVVFGTLACSGDPTQAIDVSSFEAGTYGVYITYVQTPAAFENRTFWQPAGTPGEYAQNVPTRLVANWSMTVTQGTPGPEWLQVARLDVPGNALTDVRPLYFEGRPDQGFASTWGSATDRNPDRAQATIGDLQTFTRAMRTALEDVKGPGLTRWWENMIGGQNIGFAGTATLGRTAWGDGLFYAQSDAEKPSLTFDADATLGFDRDQQTFFHTVGGVRALTLDAGDLTLPGNLNAVQVNLQAPAAASAVFGLRGTAGTGPTFLDFLAAGRLAGRLDSQQRWLLGTGAGAYVQPTSPAALTVADTSGNTLLRLDTSAQAGVAATLSLRANAAAATVRFVPSGTTPAAAATFALQALPASFALQDSVNGNAVFTYTPQNRVLDFSGSTPTARTYAVAAGYQGIASRANIYQWVVPAQSTAQVVMPASGGSVTVTGAGPVVFPLPMLQGATVTSLYVYTARNTTSASAYSVAGVLFATPVNGSGASPATALASFNITLQPDLTPKAHALGMTVNVPVAGYQNFYLSLTDVDPNAVNQIYAIVYYQNVPQLPAGIA